MPVSYADELDTLMARKPISYADELDTLMRDKPTPSIASPADTLKQAAQSVTDEMGTGERLLVGLGRGFDQVKQGAIQLGLEAGGLLGFDTKQALADQAAQEAANKQIFDAGVGQTTAGTIGAVAGEAAPYLVMPGASLARGAGVLSKVAAGAMTGAGVGAMQYVDPNESRLGNTAQAAALGGLATGAMEGIARGGTKLINAARGKLAPVADEVTALGKQHGVPVFAPDVAGSPLMSKVATLAEDVPLVGMTKPRLQQAEAAGAAAQDLVSRLSPQVDDVGRAIQDSLSRRTSALQKAAGVRYDRVAQAADPLGPVPLSNFQQTAQRLLAEAKQDIDPNNALISQLERLSKVQSGPNFSAARQFRSNFGDEIRRLESGMDMKAARPLQQLKGALEQDMNGFAQNAGPDVAAKWKAADRFFRERVVPQRESDIVRGMRNRNPDEVFKQFIKAGSQDRAQRLYNALDNKGRAAIKSGILNQALEKATLNGANGVAFSPAKFAGELEKLQGSVGVFFKGADKKEIDGFTKLMQHVQRAGQVAENPPTGNRLVLPVLMGEALAPGTTAATLGAGGLSRLLFTTEPGKRLLLASNRLPVGSPHMQRALRAFRERLPLAAGGSQADNAR